MHAMLYVFTFGGDPLTLEILSSEEAARARTQLDVWWRRNRRAGKILMAAQLQAPLTATTIRFVEGRSVLYDGPFAPEPEAIGGYTIIDVASMDEALALACTWPGGGYVEIRPLRSPRSPDEVVRSHEQTTEGGREI
jgi:hypothetical protein